MRSSGKGLSGFWQASRRGALALVFFSASIAPIIAEVSPRAEELYKRTDYQQSLRQLNVSSSDAATQNLIGRNYFMLGDFRQAIDAFQKAASTEPANSDHALWLGRAWGRRAETSNPLFAPAYASRARQWLEKSVELDDKNSEALADLFEYYLEAPGFLGGGYDKAQVVIQKISKVDPAEAFSLRAELAEKRNQYDTAEAQLRRGIELAPREVGHIIALARFLANQGRTQESDAAFAEAEQLAPESPRLWYAKADALIKQKRNLDEAKRLLQRYVASSSITPEDPSKKDAERLLSQATGGV